MQRSGGLWGVVQQHGVALHGLLGISELTLCAQKRREFFGGGGQGLRQPATPGPPGNARSHAETRQDDASRRRARPRPAGNAPLSGNARGHLATPSGTIRQRQAPYGNATCDLDVADVPEDA